MSITRHKQHLIEQEAQQRILIEQAVKSALRESGYPPMRQIDCEFECGTLRLWGRVPSYYLKQLVSVVAAKVEGITEINNDLDVGHVD
jgi:osmotically-inducible protein OsmY